jgi:predicted DNA-binding transcriptional regulator YafY
MKSDTSAELASRRRLAILALLHRQSYTSEELMKTLAQKDLFLIDREENSQKIAKRQRFQLQSDIKALRTQDCNVRFNQKSKQYEWLNSPFGLFLDGGQRSALAVLIDTFANSSLPHTEDIRHLLAKIAGLLPPEQQKELREKKRAFSIDLRETTNYQQIDTEMVKKIEFAIQSKQQLTFRYCASRDGKERQHTIEPRNLGFKNGHVYLAGWSVDWQKAFDFRLENIVPGSVETLSTTIAPSRPPAPVHELRYRLLAPIARLHVSQHFPEHQEERHLDGSVTVTARVTELFDARRTLLSYGENCIIEAPPALVKQMHPVAIHYCKTYLNSEP